jgi:hypothetical protein
MAFPARRSRADPAVVTPGATAPTLVCGALLSYQKGERSVILMGKIVGVGVALLALAAGVLLLTEGRAMAPLFDAFRSQSTLSQAAWMVIAIVAITLVFCVISLGVIVVRQRRSSRALEARLGGVREGTKALREAQAGADADMHNLARTDPEDMMAALQQRLTEALRFAQVQYSRNESSDLQSRVDSLRAQQRMLKDGSFRSWRRDALSSSCSSNCKATRPTSTARLTRSRAATR